MQPVTLITDSGATKAEWCLINNEQKETFFTQGISPYFLDASQIAELVKNELSVKLNNVVVTNLFYYGTGCANPENAKMVKSALRQVFPEANVEVSTDLMAAARALCGSEKGVACILGTGSNSCYYNGKKIMKNSPGLGYILGDEGSGAYLGKKVLQYYLYNTFDEELKLKFESKYSTTMVEVLENVYKKPMPNRYLASFTHFLAENRDHFMVENILEDGINDFFFTHLCKYREVWKYPVSFVGGVAAGFKDVIVSLCNTYEFDLGKVLKNPMEGLVEYYKH